MTQAVAQEVYATVRRALPPIVDLCLDAKVGPGELYAIIRAMYVCEADKRRVRRNKKQGNVAGIAADTGLTREDVKALLNEPLDKPPRARRGGKVRAQLVLEAWWNDKTWQDPLTGEPALLHLDKGRGSFTALVKSSSGTGKTAVKSVLDELLRSRAVRELDDGRLQVVSRTCVSVRWNAAGIAQFGEEMRRLGEHFLHNLKHPEDPRFAHSVSAKLNGGAAMVLVPQVQEDAQIFLEAIQEMISHPKYQQQSTPRGKDAIQLVVSLQVAREPASRPRSRAGTSARRVTRGASSRKGADVHDDGEAD